MFKYINDHIIICDIVYGLLSYLNVEHFGSSIIIDKVFLVI